MTSPFAVSVTPGALLSNTSTPSIICSRLICALTAGCVTPSDWAARVKLRRSITASSVRSRSVGMFVIPRPVQLRAPPLERSKIDDCNRYNYLYMPDRLLNFLELLQEGSWAEQ